RHVVGSALLDAGQPILGVVCVGGVPVRDAVGRLSDLDQVAKGIGRVFGKGVSSADAVDRYSSEPGAVGIGARWIGVADRGNSAVGSGDCPGASEVVEIRVGGAGSRGVRDTV